MHYIGIDLAWGDKRPTGLAVIDDDARLLYVSAVPTDDGIEHAGGVRRGDCLAAIHAPSWSRMSPGRARPSNS